MHKSHSHRYWITLLYAAVVVAIGVPLAPADEPLPARTSLSNREIKYTVPEKGYTVLRRGPLEAVVVDNREVDDEVLSGHMAGYHGVAVLKHQEQPKNLFVPRFAGLNFVNIHDGRPSVTGSLYDPRFSPMELRRINEYTAELYQAPTPNWGLESCMRYELLEKGIIEVTFECIPRRDTYQNGYIGLLWASYIDKPESMDIHFLGKQKDAAPDGAPEWVRGVSPQHGTLATHVGIQDSRVFKHDPDFNLPLVFSESNWHFTQPWYFGRCRDMVFAQMFRAGDQVRLTQTPYGYANGIPGWDFQWFIPNYKIDQRYQLVMRAAYFPVKDFSDATVYETANLIAFHARTAMENARQSKDSSSPSLKVLGKLRLGEQTKIVCLGDSVTGLYYHTGGLRTYTDMLGIAVQRAVPGSNVKMINAGISGNTTADGLGRLEKDVLDHQPDLVTVTFGLNDMGGIPLEQYQTNLKTLINRIRATGSEVMLGTPNNVIDTSGRPVAKLEKYCDAVRAVGKEMNVPVADNYAGMEKLKAADPAAWRLLLSDEIHPNMDGHKRMAEIFAQAITGKAVSVEDVAPQPPSLAGIAAAVAAGKAIKVLAMPPFDSEIKPLLEKRFPNAKLEITTWKTADQTIVQLEQEAQARVRSLGPDLVVIAVPRSAKGANLEQFIHGYSWIMNWSLSFGHKEWECLVIHPDVADPEHPDKDFDALVRKLVRAQDLQLIDRQTGDKRPAAEIVDAALPQK